MIKGKSNFEKAKEGFAFVVKLTSQSIADTESGDAFEFDDKDTSEVIERICREENLTPLEALHLFRCLISLVEASAALLVYNTDFRGQNPSWPRR